MKSLLLKNLSLLLMASFLSACSVFAPITTPTVTEYQITAVPPPTIKKQARRIALAVVQPQASGILNTMQMAYSVKPYQIAYFSKNRWAEMPADMLWPLIIKTLQDTYYFRTIGPSGALGNYDYYLSTSLLQFQQVFFNQQSLFKIVLHAQLINAKNNRIINSQNFTVEEKATHYGPYGGVIAANHATAKILAALAKWTLSQL